MFVCLVLVSNMVGGIKFHTLNACFTIISNPVNNPCLQFSNHIHYLCFSIQLAQNFFPREEAERAAKQEERRKYEDDINNISGTVNRMVNQVSNLIQKNQQLPEKDRYAHLLSQNYLERDLSWNTLKTLHKQADLIVDDFCMER